ncbi:inositol polyphosphate multikinase [Drosophila innubila]|uniref:inositol polyphosphate multikinase n=1 Tax=Drosophila innubila TaxID=198719 RepID=UPI00148D823D|nr:inositol polyphosphate multikinase [Drosophila innubila]
MAKQEQVEKVLAMPAVPLGYRELGTQVAGHRFEASNASAVGLLQDGGGEGCVFKPMGKPECGEREINFMSDSNESNDSALLAELSMYVPRYYGQLKLVVNQREHTFLQLQDLTHGMRNPCVMDVKVGRRTWDPLSSPHKRAIEEQKYVICKQELGLCLPGFQVYQPAEEQAGKPRLIRHGRDYGKSLNVQGFHQALALFFNVSCKESHTLLHEVLRQLRSIRSWFKRQRLLHFYASSLLICYDFEQLQQLKKPEQSLQNGYHQSETVAPPVAPDQWIRVRCIDFAHIFPAADAAPDHNYMAGLQSLIDIVESMLQR